MQGVKAPTAFPNGTLYVEQVNEETAFYDSSNNGISVQDTSMPISSLDRVYKVEGDVETPVDLSDCTVASDGLSFTICGLLDTKKQLMMLRLGDSNLSPSLFISTTCVRGC